MAQVSTQIIKEISRLISLVEDSNIQQTDKLKLIKVLLSVKLKLIELLGNDISAEAKIMRVASLARNGGESAKTQRKHELILQFIRQNSSRVSAAQLLELGISGRSLRRYIKSLCASGKISVEKEGREHFYTIVS